MIAIIAVYGKQKKIEITSTVNYKLMHSHDLSEKIRIYAYK